MLVRLLVAFNLVFSAQTLFAEVDQAEDLTPKETLDEGSYSSRDGFLSNLKIESWADEFAINGNLIYVADQTYKFRFSATVSRDRENIFSGSGMMQIDYLDNTRCSYPVTLSIKAYKEGLFIRHTAPDTVPLQAGECESAGADTEHRSPEPYILNR